MQVFAVIPAHNEAPRIAPVVRAVLAARCLAGVLVVDDGSTDGTARVARAAGADVLELRPNRGKGGAMRAGVAWASNFSAGAVCFVDADLSGLRPDHVCAIVEPVASGRAVQACGLRDYGSLWNEFQKGMPIITGERCVAMRALLRVPPEFWSGYKIEVAINEACRRVGGAVHLAVFDGVTAAMKWQKEAGPEEGARRMRAMFWEVLDAADRLRTMEF
jgi:hypothetical protein